MTKHFPFLFIILSLLALSSCLEESSIIQSILKSYKAKPLKEQFKVYHFLFNKEYNLNSEEGVKRYRIFKENSKWIDEENSKGHSYNLGLTEFADMTWEEIQKKYLSTESFPEPKQLPKEENPANFFDLYADAEEEVINSTGDRTPIDWRSHFLPARKANDCGWALGVADAAAGNWHVANPTEEVSDFSAQQLFDCAGTTNAAYLSANYVLKTGLFKEADYSWRGGWGFQCKYNDMINDKVTVYKSKWSDGVYKFTDTDGFYTMLSKSPVLNRPAASKMWFYYISGILTQTLADCPSVYSRNIFTVAVGWGSENGQEYVIIRQHFGPTFGENGYMRIAFQPDVNASCYATSVGWRPSFKAKPN